MNISNQSPKLLHRSFVVNLYPLPLTFVQTDRPWPEVTCALGQSATGGVYVAFFDAELSVLAQWLDYFVVYFACHKCVLPNA